MVRVDIKRSRLRPFDWRAGSTKTYQDLEEKTKSDAATSAKPPKNIGPAAKRSSGIHHDKGNDMSDDRAGTSKKNIVTNPLSLSVTVKAT